MSQISLLLLVIAFSVIFAMVAASASSFSEEQQYLEDDYFGPRLVLCLQTYKKLRLRRVPLAYHGENAYLQQLLSNLKPRFKRSL